jgi:hypothetical protein
MLIKYQNILYKLPKLSELDYLSVEKKNEFYFVLVYYLHLDVSLQCNNNINIIEFSKLSSSKKNDVLKQTYKNIFYDINNFQKGVKPQDTHIIFNNEYIENL